MMTYIPPIDTAIPQCRNQGNHMSRYTISYIANAECNSLTSEVLAATDDAAEAKRLAVQHSGMGAYGAGILDTQSGDIDVGFGFGAEAPELDD